ncbi:MAG: UDP-3-O-(3-hydroxymyristoyl)glucosamine N-acyltransferase, partial [Pseudomonadota bacterium]
IGAAHPSAAGPDQIALAMDPKFIEHLPKGAARTALLPPGTDHAALGLAAAIFAPRPRYALAGVTSMFQHPLDVAPGRHPSAVVAPDAEIGADVTIGPFAVIGPGARIGDRVVIAEHVSVGRGAEIGADAILYAGARIGFGVSIGERTRVHENSVIGSDGFSFVTPEPGTVESAERTGRIEVGVRNSVWARIHSLGSVRIGADVEIGACVTVDRGTVVDTSVGDGTKIDNLVQIGHNCRIGENCLFCGHVGLAGSVDVGDRVVLGGKVGVADHVTIGDDAMAMATAGIVGPVKPRTIVGGIPALPRDEAARLHVALRRLPRIADDVAALKKRFSSNEGSG